MGPIASRSRRESLCLTPVEESRLDDFISNIRSFGDIFAGTTEEIQHYYSKSDIRFYEVVDNDQFRTVGTICIVSVKNKTHVSGITMEPSYVEAGAIFPLDYRMMFNERSRVNYPFLCATYPSNITFLDISVGRVRAPWTIHEYTISVENIVEQTLDYEEYETERLREEDIGEILRFERKVMGLWGRGDYIDTCLRRSAIAYLVRKKNNREIRAFGMLSKPEEGKSLLGPVYGHPSEAPLCVVDALLNYAKANFSYGDIIAYCPEKSFGHLTLNRHADFEKTSKSWLRRSLCENYEINGDYIVALGSIVFDVC